MSTSIRRPRRRPRVDSMCFQALGWVVFREAVYEALGPGWIAPGVFISRAVLRDASSKQVYRLIALAARRSPAARRRLYVARVLGP